MIAQPGNATDIWPNSDHSAIVRPCQKWDPEGEQGGAYHRESRLGRWRWLGYERGQGVAFAASSRDHHPGGCDEYGKREDR
jgi:hypothetical protein